MSSFFFFNDTATTEIYTLSLHDALPIFESAGETGARTADARGRRRASGRDRWRRAGHVARARPRPAPPPPRSWSCRRRPCLRRSGIRPPASPLGGVVLGVGVARAVVELHLDAGDPHLARRRRRPALALADLAQAGEQIGLEGREFLFGDLAELEAHLRGQQLLAHDAVVVELAVDGVDDLVQHELETADQQGVEDDHGGYSRPAGGGEEIGPCTPHGSRLWWGRS